MSLIFSNKSFETYELIQVTVKLNDPKFILHGITGKLIYEKEVNKCFDKKDSIADELSLVIKNYSDKIINNAPHTYDESGDSKDEQTFFLLHSGGTISVSCTDWSDKLELNQNFPDLELKVQITNEEFNNFLQYEAYN